MNIENNNIAVLEKKLKQLIEERNELKKIFDKKIKELSNIRIKELRITLKIYQLEELYLKKIKSKLISK